MANLRDKDSDQLLGTITDDDVQFLIDQLEEESRSDTDYYIDADTIDMLEEEGGAASLIALLRSSLGEREGMEIEWSGE
jgi:hypothetical protein